MTVCTDVYVRPQTCDVIRIYPSQVHPGGPTSGGPKGGKHYPDPWGPRHDRSYVGFPPRRPVRNDDDDVLAALASQGLI